MPVAQFPASATFLPPVGQSLVAQYLARYLNPLGSNALPYDQMESTIQGFLAIASLHPFDPNERFDIRRHPDDLDHRLSLLQGVLELTSHVYDDRPLRAWPKKLDEFGPHLVKPRAYGPDRGIDTEWAAAALIASGANPWVDFSIQDGSLPEEVRLTILHGFGGVLDRLLDAPLAPSAQWLADTVFDAGLEESLWKFCSRERRANSVLEVLLAGGARLSDPKLVASVLSMATPEAIELLARCSLPPLAPSLKSKVEETWKKRASQGELSSRHIEQMQLSTWGQVNDKLSPAAIEINALLSVNWGGPKNNNNVPITGHDFGADRLCARADRKTGVMSGRWSTLAALAVSALRQANVGARPWSVAGMLSRKHDPDTKRWLSAKCSEAPFKGSLVDALGFDWRPGIAIDGPVALALFGQETKDLLRPENNEALEKSFRASIANFGNATGVEDVKAWAVASAPAAVDFTLLVLKSPTVNAAKSFLLTWCSALEKNPQMAQSLSDEQKIGLLAALTANFRLSSNWFARDIYISEQMRALEKIEETLFPGVVKNALSWMDETTGVEFRAALFAWLSKNGPYVGVDEVLSLLEKHQSRMDAPAIDLLQAWSKEHHFKQPADRTSFQRTLEALRLHASTPIAPSRRSTLRL